MRLKNVFLLGFLLIAIFALSQESINFSNLGKDKQGRYFVKNTGKVYTGKAYDKYKNNQVGMSGEIKNGYFEGKWTWWYEDGSKKRQTTYKNGIKTGYSYWWYKNGQKKSQIKFINNRNVEQKRWDKRGKLLPNPRMR